jgi:hypothetical protein
MVIAVTILPAGAAGVLADLVVLVALADLLVAGLVMDFFDTAMGLFLAFEIWV